MKNQVSMRISEAVTAWETGSNRTRNPRLGGRGLTVGTSGPLPPLVLLNLENVPVFRNSSSAVLLTAAESQRPFGSDGDASHDLREDAKLRLHYSQNRSGSVSPAPMVPPALGMFHVKTSAAEL